MPRQLKKKGTIIYHSDDLVKATIDPGRKTLLNTSKHTKGELVGYNVIMPCAQHYHKIGVNLYNKQTNKWRKPLQNAHLERSQNHGRIAIMSDLIINKRVNVRQYILLR